MPLVAPLVTLTLAHPAESPPLIDTPGIQCRHNSRINEGFDPCDLVFAAILRNPRPSMLVPNQPSLQRGNGCLGTIGNVQPHKNDADVALHGRFRNAQVIRDLLVAPAFDDQF